MATTINSLSAETLQDIFILASQAMVSKKPQVHTMTLGHFIVFVTIGRFWS